MRRNKNSKVLVFGDSGVGKVCYGQEEGKWAEVGADPSLLSLSQTTLLAYWARDGMGRPRSWMADTVSANERGFTLRIIHHEEGFWNWGKRTNIPFFLSFPLSFC